MVTYMRVPPEPRFIIVWVSVCDVITERLPCGRISKTHNKKAADTGGAAEAFKMPKRKCTFTDELRKKFPVYRPGRDIWETECTVCKAGTYVSVSNKGDGDLTAHMDTENILLKLDFLIGYRRVLFRTLFHIIYLFVH